MYGISTKLRYFVVALATIASAFTATLATPTAASAGTTTCDALNLPDIKSPDGGAQGCFRADGDELLICDTKADGHHPAIIYNLDWTTSDTRVDYYGSAGLCRSIDEDFPENHKVYFKVLNVEGSTTLSYSGWKSVTT
jgi:hypothetical protein